MSFLHSLEDYHYFTASHLREAAKFRQANKDCLRHSQHIAMMMPDKIEHLHLTQKTLSERMGCTQQFVSKILRGQENLSIEAICKLEDSQSLQILPKSLRRNKINSGSHV
jgi:transcriptional regulator with XRE-family HTH domain